MHCDHTVYVSADFVHPETKACLLAPSRLFPVPPGREVGMCKLDVISQERLKMEVKLLLSANRKS